MKKVFILMLAILLIFTGCAGGVKTNDVSVKDVSYPYDVLHAEDTVEITLWDAANSGINWKMEAIPKDVCQVTREAAEEAGACRFRVVGEVEGAAQLTFSAVRDDATELVKGGRILLIDDVLTTGVTLSEAARALLEGGAEEVRAVVCARVW